MAIFYYTAKSYEGKTKTGTLEAKNKFVLARILRDEGFILTSARSLEEEKKPARGWSALGRKIFLKTGFSSIFKRVSLIEKTMFARHLAIMIGAGFSLHKALETLTHQTTNQNFKKIINDIVIGIKKGETLADGLVHYPKVFDKFFVSMVKVGEKGGNLEEVLKILAQHLKKEHEFRSKVRGAMVYPAVIVVAMIGIGILMMVVVMPKITAMFEELKVDLPITTRILIAVSKFLSNYFLVAIVVFLILIIILVKFLKTPKGRYLLSWFFLKMPFINNITKKINCARFARSFSSLMKSGVPIVESLNIAADTVDNVFYSKSLIGIAIEVKKGINLQQSLEKYETIYPVLVSQMVGVGEETGELADIVLRLADFYEEEVTNITNNLTAIIEPVLMIIIGIIVGFFAISMIQPMYSMMNAL